MATGIGITCSQCWTAAAPGKTHCPRCGAKLTGATPSVAGLLKAYPWLGVLLALSLLATLWAATRRPAPLEPAPQALPAVEAVAPTPAPAPEPDFPPIPMPVPEKAPATAPSAPTEAVEAPPPPPASSRSPELQPDGTWK